MHNLAGDKNADNYILDELYLADIPTKAEKPEGEVPYTIIGVLNGWTFKRAWNYYVATTVDGLGIPYDVAVELHERPNPIHQEFGNIGMAVRVNGHCSCPHPNEDTYPSIEEIEEEFVSARKMFPDVDFDTTRAFAQSTLRSLNGIRYVRLYHIDSVVGLKEFAKTLRRLEKEAWRNEHGTDT